MADLKISQLPSATTPLAGTEVLPIVQSSATKQVSIANLTAGRSVSVADATLTTGNLVIGTSGKGIDFSATGQAGGMTSELLNDYEEGTFTPVVTGTASNPTISYTTQEGVYTKIGRLVIATAFISINTASGGSGSCWISLPFTAASSATYTGSGNVSFATGWGTAAPASSRIIGGQTVGTMYYLNGTSYSQSSVLSFGSGANLVVTFIYEAN